MNLKEKIVGGVLDKLAWVLIKVGFLPEGDGRPNGVWGNEQFGDSRDCDSLEEVEAFKRIWGDRTLSPLKVE